MAIALSKEAGTGSALEKLARDALVLPLCRAYLAAFTRSSRTFDVAGRPTTAIWCVGVLNNGLIEISGPWLSVSDRSQTRLTALHELSRRGVERIRFEVPDGGPTASGKPNLVPITEALSSPSPLSRRLSQDGGSYLECHEAAKSSSAPSSILSDVHERLMERVEERVRSVQRRLDRALRRGSSFADQESAVAFVGKLLAREQQAFDDLRPPRARPLDSSS